MGSLRNLQGIYIPVRSFVRSVPWDLGPDVSTLGGRPSISSGQENRFDWRCFVTPSLCMWTWRQWGETCQGAEKKLGKLLESCSAAMKSLIYATIHNHFNMSQPWGMQRNPTCPHKELSCSWKRGLNRGLVLTVEEYQQGSAAIPLAQAWVRYSGDEVWLSPCSPSSQRCLMELRSGRRVVSQRKRLPSSTPSSLNEKKNDS